MSEGPKTINVIFEAGKDKRPIGKSEVSDGGKFVVPDRSSAPPEIGAKYEVEIVKELDSVRFGKIVKMLEDKETVKTYEKLDRLGMVVVRNFRTYGVDKLGNFQINFSEKRSGVDGRAVYTVIPHQKPDGMVDVDVIIELESRIAKKIRVPDVKKSGDLLEQDEIEQKEIYSKKLAEARTNKESLQQGVKEAMEKYLPGINFKFLERSLRDDFSPVEVIIEPERRYLGGHQETSRMGEKYGEKYFTFVLDDIQLVQKEYSSSSYSGYGSTSTYMLSYEKFLEKNPEYGNKTEGQLPKQEPLETDEESEDSLESYRGPSDLMLPAERIINWPETKDLLKRGEILKV